MVIFHCYVSSPEGKAYVRPIFQGISLENMAKHMVRLRTSILGS